MPLTETQQTLLNLFTSFSTAKNKKEVLEKIKIVLPLTPINFSDEKTQHSLLHRAVLSGEMDLLELLLSNPRLSEILNLKTKKGNTAIFLAGTNGNLLMFEKLHKVKAAYSHKEFITKLYGLIKDPLSDEANEIWKIINFIHDHTPKQLYDWHHRKIIGLYAYPFPLKEEAQKKEFERQKIVAERFFRVGQPLEKSKHSTKLYGEILTAMDMGWPVELDHYSARAVVIAISKLLQKLKKFPSLVFKLGETELSCQPSDEQKRQVGNLLVTIKNLNRVPCYGDEIMTYLTPILGKESERQKKLAHLLQENSKEMRSFVLDNFNKEGQIKLANEDTYQSKGDTGDQNLKNTIHILNFLSFIHSIGEVTRRLYRDKEGQLAAPSASNCYGFPEANKSDEFPVASFNARAIELMRSGNISCNDIFGNSGEAFEQRPKYGVVAGKNTILSINEKVMPKACEINKLMSNYYQTIFTPNYAKHRPNNYMRVRSFWLRTELGDQFGGDSESDSDSYTSDSSDTEYLSYLLPKEKKQRLR